jgi:hypothetical protein
MLQCKIILDDYVAVHLYSDINVIGVTTMNNFEDAQKFGKQGFESFVASATAMTKGYQAIAQEMVEFATKTAEHNKATFDKATAARSFERIAEVQQGYAKEAYDAILAQTTKLGDMYKATATDAFKPYEATFSAFGVKAPAK